MRTSWADLRAAALDREIACPRCHHLNTDDARDCVRCGAAMVTAVRARHEPRCANCHMWLETDARWCGGCGAHSRGPLSWAVRGSASGGRRLIAGVIDAVFSFVLLVAICALLSPAEGETGGEAIGAGDVLVGVLILWFGAYLLYVIATAWGGQTLGKRICGIRIVRADGGPITRGLTFMRSVAYVFSALPLGLGFAWIGCSGRGWHDYLCDTRVVRTR